MIERRIVTSPNPLLADVRWPVFEAVGARDGPRLSLLAGVHGCEYPAIAAVRRFMAGLDTGRLSGSILAVPTVSPTSFARRSAFVVPEDGRNLNRSFPGDPNGSFTDALADHVFREFIAPAEMVIDLHGGDLFEALEPFALYDRSPQEQIAQRLGRAYGLTYVIRNQSSGLGGDDQRRGGRRGNSGDRRRGWRLWAAFRGGRAASSARAARGPDGGSDAR
jgi:uncharacterized protein